ASDRHLIIGLERARTAKARERLVHAAPVLERKTEVDVRDGEARCEREGVAAGGLRLFRLSHGTQRGGGIGVRLGMARPPPGGGAEMIGRLFEPALLAERRTQVVVRLRMFGIEREHAAVARLGIDVALSFAQKVAKLVVSLEKARIEGDRFPERRFRLFVPAQ